jgi:protein phosphatase
VPAPLRLVEVAHASNVGRVRSHNEDRSLARPPLLAVADGMGGAKAGEVAAQITVESLDGSAPTPEDLRRRLTEANARIRESAQTDPSRLGMGTTVAAILAEADAVTVMHVGDSRAYLWRGGGLRRLTDDHSVVAEMVRQGQLAPEDAERHPSRNIITRALGADDDIEIEETRIEIRDGDVVLLCTDGLSGLVDEEAIGEALASAPGLADAADALVAAALAGGGTDNVTVVLGRFGPDVPGAAPAIPEAGHSDDTARMPAIDAGADARLGAARALEPAPPRRRRLRAALGIAAAVLAVLVAFGLWAGSRTYFVDADDAGTVRVYHGAPLSLAGVDLFAEWGDTGVIASPVASAAPGALGRTARGQGEAVARAVDIVWAFGLPAVPEITPPPGPTRTTGTPAQ